VCAEWFKETVKNKDSNTTRVLVFNCTHGRDGLRLLSSISAIQEVVQFDHAVFSTNVTFKKGYTTGEKKKRKKNFLERCPPIAPVLYASMGSKLFPRT
jgi:folylpolyglutamate synthase